MTALMLMTALLLQDAKPEVFSGPQKGEKTPACKVRFLNGRNAEKELDVIAEYKGAPTLFVYIHETTRLVAGVVRDLDSYAAKHEELKVVFVFLTADKIATLNYAPVFIKSLSLQSPLAVSLDGIEGPGAWGLNHECQMTVIVAKGNVVTDNFALLSPSAAVDAPKIRAALKVVTAPKIETLEDALKEIKRLNEIIEKLEAELAKGAKPADPKMTGDAQDPKLTEMMRGLIQRGTKEQYEAIVRQVKEYVGDNKDLKKQVNFQIGVCVEKKYGTPDGQEYMKQLLEWSKP